MICRRVTWINKGWWSVGVSGGKGVIIVSGAGGIRENGRRPGDRLKTPQIYELITSVK
jgi:hypothetical protein